VRRYLPPKVGINRFENDPSHFSSTWLMVAMGGDCMLFFNAEKNIDPAECGGLEGAD
jgi:hypothetical protein